MSIVKPKWDFAPFEPSLQIFLFTLLAVPYIGLNTHPIVQSKVIFVSACHLGITLLICAFNYRSVLSKSPADRGFQPSQEAHLSRQKIGIGRFVIKTLLNLWIYSMIMDLVFRAMFASSGDHVPPLYQSLLFALWLATVVAVGFVVESLALDRHYCKEA